MKYTIKLYCVVLILRVRRGEILVDKTYRLTGGDAPNSGLEYCVYHIYMEYAVKMRRNMIF
ncbi:MULTISPECIES: hypothetical protein [unclassified Microcoleus]|uniref:hypothetical protein n=1 Tax=unclassified Microcoleus TaxID=2642155 RepID=UPI002FD1B166